MTSIGEAAFIIGGPMSIIGDPPGIIAEYRNDKWSLLESLNTDRFGHGSITYGDSTMIIGGGGRS